MSVTKGAGSLEQVKEATPVGQVAGQLGPFAVLAFSVWCGLAAGVLEVATRILAAHLGNDGILRITRHFVWMIPLADLVLLSGLGIVLALLSKAWRAAARGRTRDCSAPVILPSLLLLFPRIYTIALLLLVLGIVGRFPFLVERNPILFRRLYRTSFVLLSVAFASLAGWIFGGDALAVWRESSRPLPPTGSPNVLLIVLDTVRADHLSVYGYARPTAPNLERLAWQGIRFDAAHSTAPWTLPSHASMFTGRWPHELGVGLFTPLDTTYPTLAEYLGSHGYLTGGFVGNLTYCSCGSGLERGFVRYEDHPLSFKRLKISKLCDLGFQAWLDWAESFATILRSIS